MGLLSKVMGRNRADMRDVAKIYRQVMLQSRKPEFFGAERFADNYDGRIDILTFNLCIIMKRLREFGENGQILSQAIFDTLRDDFEIALREEGISDKGVATRIKPMIQLFYDRLKAYDAALNDKTLSKTLSDKLELKNTSEFTKSLDVYGMALFAHLGELSLGDIAKAKFTFPTLISEP